jgi:hypothetical protein
VEQPLKLEAVDGRTATMIADTAVQHVEAEDRDSGLHC